VRRGRRHRFPVGNKRNRRNAPDYADAHTPKSIPLTVWGAHGRTSPPNLLPRGADAEMARAHQPEGAPADNVGRAYAAFAADIDNGTHTVPDFFADAVGRHEVIAAIERSAASGNA